MLTPDYLKGLPEPIVELLYSVEDCAIEDIARRVRKMGTTTRTAEIQQIALQALGEGPDIIKQKIADVLKMSRKEVERIFAESAEVATDNQAQISKVVGIPLDTGFAREL